MYFEDVVSQNRGRGIFTIFSKTTSQGILLWFLAVFAHWLSDENQESHEPGTQKILCSLVHRFLQLAAIGTMPDLSFRDWDTAVYRIRGVVGKTHMHLHKAWFFSVGKGCGT